MVTSKTILIIEDDEASQYIYGAILQHRGYRVLLASRAADGLRLVREHLPDLVVLDLGLPGVDGLHVARTIKSDPQTRDIPVVVATVHIYEDDRRRAADAGCDHFLPKPLEPALLADEVGRILEETKR